MAAEHTIFRLSLTTSVLLHAILLSSFFYPGAFFAPKMYFKTVDVVYQSLPPSEPKRHEPKAVRSLKQDALTPKPEILTPKEYDYSLELMKGFKKGATKLKSEKRLMAQLSGQDGKRHISVPMLQSDKITNPKYVNYHDKIRERIKNRAYFYVDDPQFETGEVYLSFVIASNGHLKDIKIVDRKTSTNNFLRSIGLRSIKESSPFPPFPADLKYPELSFNVVISFELGRGQ